ncbi:MAG: DUF4292 domain-containing protein [Bacteroidetes bacterium]|jgi:hypothetical protein|nr:DUF4292 domain-containing protein [Chitinophagales bacterium]MDA0199662.1 DUF4292 domain-containing protein [Bacteroidota bacterium]
MEKKSHNFPFLFQQRQQFVCLFFLSIFILVLSGGCRNKNHAPTSGNGLPTPKAPTSVQKALDLLQAQTLNPDWFSAKAHITANGSQFNQSFNADIRLRTDSALWVSITAPIIGIEVVRALITPDSARVLDRFNKNYHVYPLTELRHFTGYDLQFADFQNVLLGNPLIMPQAANTDLQKTDTLIWLNSSNNGNNEWQYKYGLKAPHYGLATAQLQNQRIRQALTILLTNFTNLAGKPFAQNRQITLNPNHPDQFYASVQYTNNSIAINQALPMPFEVTKKYTKNKDGFK